MSHDHTDSLASHDRCPTRFELELPEWSHELAQDTVIPCLLDRLAFVLELARRNVEHATGGPFAAAVFELETGRLVSLGANCVVPQAAACAHAEVMALTLAQKRRQTHDLGGAGAVAHQLVSSAQPCLMCLGATMWSGVTHLVYGATRLDVERILGFDEGPLPRHWVARLRRRGISVSGGLRRQESRQVLALYRDRGGIVYNPGR